MRRLVLYGAGGLGREVELLIRAINQQKPTWNFLGFIDDAADSALGGFDHLVGLTRKFNDLAVAITIGNIEALSAIAERIDSAAPDAEIVNLIHPDATVCLDAVEMGRGNIIAAGARLANVRLGSFNVLNYNTVFGHDTTLGDYNLVHPNATLNGEVEVGSRVIIGAGATVIPRVSIGDGATIAIGAVVGRSVDPGCTVAGNPARVVRRTLET